MEGIGTLELGSSFFIWMKLATPACHFPATTPNKSKQLARGSTN